MDQHRIADEMEFINILLCPKNEGDRFREAKCIEGECEKCPDLGHTINQVFAKFVEDSGTDVLFWKRWELKECTFNKKKEGKFEEVTATRRVLLEKHGEAKDLIEDLICDTVLPTQAETFVSHLFNASWQVYQVERVLR